jgi:hypothetical protein
MLFPTSIRVGRRGVPKFFMLDLAYPPHQFVWRMIRYRKWSMKQANHIVRVKMENADLELMPSVWTAVFSEWSYWKQHYLEFLPKNAKTVLDVGAACGETALLYLLNGIEKVICLEPRPANFGLLEKNSLRNNWNISAFQEGFQLGLLTDLEFDFMKMDCEGCESELLKADRLPPCVIEVHQDRVRVEDLKRRFPGLKLAKRQTGFGLWIVGSSSPLQAASHR